MLRQIFERPMKAPEQSMTTLVDLCTGPSDSRSRNALCELQDALLFTGSFSWMFYVTLVGFCAAIAQSILTSSPRINFFHGMALTLLSCFGGSTLAAIVCGSPMPIVCNEALVPVCITTWAVVYALPSLALGFLVETTACSLLNSIAFEIQRCHVVMNCVALAAATLPAALAQPSGERIAIIGPIISGLLGGCGGGFMPLNKGLEPLASGINWRISSSAVASLWFFFAALYPPSKAAIGLSIKSARFIAVAFFVCVPLIEQATGIKTPFGFNPLVRKKSAEGAKPPKADTPLVMGEPVAGDKKRD